MGLYHRLRAPGDVARQEDRLRPVLQERRGLLFVAECQLRQAIASDDEGRTWHDWAEVDTWPGSGVSAFSRRGNDLFIHPD